MVTLLWVKMRDLEGRGSLVVCEQAVNQVMRARLKTTHAWSWRSAMRWWWPERQQNV